VAVLHRETGADYQAVVPLGGNGAMGAVTPPGIPGVAPLSGNVPTGGVTPLGGSVATGAVTPPGTPGVTPLGGTSPLVVRHR